jgi:hypothetical protein
MPSIIASRVRGLFVYKNVGGNRRDARALNLLWQIERISHDKAETLSHQTSWLQSIRHWPLTRPPAVTGHGVHNGTRRPVLQPARAC